MKYGWQFDPLLPDKPVELTCDGVVIATTTLNNAQELARKLNSQSALYEALKELLVEYDPWEVSPTRNKALSAIAKADGK